MANNKTFDLILDKQNEIEMSELKIFHFATY